MAGKHEGAMVRILLLRTRNEKNGRRETYNASLFTARDTTSNSCVATGLHYLARPVVGDTQDRSSGSFRQGAKGGCVRGSVSQPGLGAVPGLARPGDAVTSTGPPANSRMITVPSQAAGSGIVMWVVQPDPLQDGGMAHLPKADVVTLTGGSGREVSGVRDS